MWFNILKSNLASIQETVAGDTQATNIDVKIDGKCKEKLQNFAKKLESSGLNVDRKVNNINEIDEGLACIVVESLDKHFNTKPTPRSDIYGIQYNNSEISTRDKFNLKGIEYGIDINSDFAPFMDFTRIVIFDINVMAWASNNRGSVIFMNYKILTLDKNMTFSKVAENGSDISKFREKAKKEFETVRDVWRSS